MGETDASITRGTLDDGAARLEEATLFRIFNEVQCRAVLDAPARILELGFTEYFAARFFGQTGQADERGIANC